MMAKHILTFLVHKKIFWLWQAIFLFSYDRSAILFIYYYFDFINLKIMKKSWDYPFIMINFVNYNY